MLSELNQSQEYNFYKKAKWRRHSKPWRNRNFFLGGPPSDISLS